MKKLILILTITLFTICLNAQRVWFDDEMTVPVGDDTTWNKMFYDNDAWSIQFDFSNFDSLDAGSAADLYCYCIDEPPDSSLFPLVWVDLNLDGSNDNPWELSNVLNADSSLTLLIWGEVFPCRWIGFKLERDSVSPGLILDYWITKR